MESLNIEPTACTPAVRFDPDRSVLMLSGESYPENAFEFFAPILSWVETRLDAGPPAGLTIEIHLNYLNTSSVKCMIDLLDLLQEAHDRQQAVGLVWYCDTDNESARELAEEFGEDVTFPFVIEAEAETA